MKLPVYIIWGALFFVAQQINAQVYLVNRGANIELNANRYLKVEGNIENEGRINNNGQIYLQADWSQPTASSAYLGTGSLHFEGTSNQNLSSANTLSIHNLTVNNANNLLLASSIQITNQLDLSNNASVVLNNANLSLDNSATIINFDQNHFIVTNAMGVLSQEVNNSTKVFPVGNSSYNPAQLQNLGTSDVFSIRVEDQMLEDGLTGAAFTTGVVDRTWHIAEGLTGGSLVNLSLEWQIAEELSNFDRNDAAIVTYFAGQWNRPFPNVASTAVAAGRFEQTASAANNFLAYGIASRNQTLPIELLSFEAERKNQYTVNLEWSTASETNNQGFEIERMLANKQEFQTLAFVPAEEGGGNHRLRNYHYPDPNAYHGFSYYRLKQLDEDGQFSYSEVRVVDNNRNQEEIGLKVYPNPTANELQLYLSHLQEEQRALIQIVNTAGTIVYEEEHTISQNKVITIEAVANLNAASYFVKITTANGEQKMTSFVKYD